MDYRKANLRQEYLKQSVMTANPADLIVMLFDACIKNLKLAEICLTENQDFGGTHAHFINAQDIILELVNCLDPGIELSSQLLDIYDFLLRTLREMNIKKDLSLLPDVLEILVSMRDTWQRITKSSYGPTSEVSCGVNADRQEKLRSLMTEALKLCEQLRDYSNDNFGVIMHDDDEKLLEVLDGRETMIDALAAIENRIDDILEDASNEGGSTALPPDAEALRRSLRAVLDDITAQDMEIMKLVGGKMQKYKVETLKARSRQSFAAYIRSVSYGQAAGDSFDLSK